MLSKLKGISLAKNWCRRLLIVIHFSYTNYHFLNFELQQSYSQWQLTKPEGFKYQASDGKGSAIHTLFAQDFAAVGSSSFNPHAQFPVHSAEWTVWLLRFEISLTLSTVDRAGLKLLTLRSAIWCPNHCATSPMYNFFGIEQLATKLGFPTIGLDIHGIYGTISSALKCFFSLYWLLAITTRLWESTLPSRQRNDY